MDVFELLIVAAGLLCASAGFFDWDWFMKNPNAQFISLILTRTGARIVYIVLGLGVAVLCTLISVSDPQGPQENKREEEGSTEMALLIDWDRGEPGGCPPPTPPGIRVRTTAVRST